MKDEAEAVTEPRRFQFSLRKLFLWTAVVAVYLGVGKAIGLALGEDFPVALILPAVWVGIVGVVRTAFGSQIAVLLSMAAGAALNGYLAYQMRTSFSSAAADMASGIVFGCLFGLTLFAATVVLSHIIGRIDELMERTNCHD